MLAGWHYLPWWCHQGKVHLTSGNKLRQLSDPTAHFHPFKPLEGPRQLRHVGIGTSLGSQRENMSFLIVLCFIVATFASWKSAGTREGKISRRRKVNCSRLFCCCCLGCLNSDWLFWWFCLIFRSTSLEQGIASYPPLNIFSEYWVFDLRVPFFSSF